MAVISARWDGFLSCKHVTELYHLDGIALLLVSGRTCSHFVKIADALTITLSKSNGKSKNSVISVEAGNVSEFTECFTSYKSKWNTRTKCRLFSECRLSRISLFLARNILYYKPEIICGTSYLNGMSWLR